MNTEKVRQILDALKLTEQVISPTNPTMYVNQCIITGEQRATLIAELVTELTKETVTP